MNEYLKELPDLNLSQSRAVGALLSEIYTDDVLNFFEVDPVVSIYVLKVVLRHLDQNKAINELIKE